MKKIVYVLPHLFNMMICREAVASESVASPNLIWMSIRMFTVLAFLLGLIILAFYVIKRINVQRNGFLLGQKQMQLIETLYLGPKRSLALLKVGKELFILGISPSQISFLTSVAGPSECPEEFEQTNKAKVQEQTRHMRGADKGFQKMLTHFGLTKGLCNEARGRS
jgi:flagellar protein FliO/FliZ